MHYEINVSKAGQHFFATHARSITTEAKLKEVHDELSKVFTRRKGFKISVKCVQNIHSEVEGYEF